MTYQHKRFHTNGANALKAEDVEFDVFVKPQFTSSHNQASIIDFDDARIARLVVVDAERTGKAVSPSARESVGLLSRAKRKARADKLLGNLFSSGMKSSRKKNTYRSEDLVTFAKGFSVTGLTMFVMILFGV